MKPKEYVNYLNRQIIDKVTKRAGTKSVYLLQIARGDRGCSPSLAVNLEEASKFYAKRGTDLMTAEEILGLDDLREKRQEEIREIYGNAERNQDK